MTSFEPLDPAVPTDRPALAFQVTETRACLKEIKSHFKSTVCCTCAGAVLRLGDSLQAGGPNRVCTQEAEAGDL